MRHILSLLSVVILAGCFFDSNLDKQDPIAGLSRSDFQQLHDVPPVAEGPPIPRLALQLDKDSGPRIAEDKILSISVSEKIPLKDVLMEISAKAGVDIEIDPRIQGGVNFTATRQTFPRILTRLCRIASLRYKVEEGVVQVEPDDPYLKTYALDYLSLSRTSASQIGIATNVFAAVQNITRSNGSMVSTDAQNNNNSVTKIDSSSKADFWPEVEANIESILENTRPKMLRASPVVAVMKEGSVSASKPFAINRQAGLVSIFGNQMQHDEVASYLNRLRRSIQSQVLIEARIIEVELNEDFQSGINWRTLMAGTLNAAARFGPAAAGAPFLNATTATDGVVTLSLNSPDFGGILNFVRGFGTTRTLSSPRLTVLNNQPAILKVARNEVYFTSTVESTPVVASGGGSAVSIQRTVNSTPNTVPVGFLMTVQPAINLDRNEVTLNLRPTISFIVDRVDDPSVKIAAADANVTGVTSSIPVVAVREMDSVLTLPSGSVAVMGGLMQNTSGNVETGVPFADEIPILGNLAKSRTNTGRLTELVILLRASIVEGAAEPDKQDQELYQRYTRDRRPLPMPKAKTEDLVRETVPVPKAHKTTAVEAQPIGYVRRKTEKKPPGAEEEKPKPKKPKKNKKMRKGASPPHAPMDVSPPITPPKPHGPMLVPQYDTRPDSFPDD
jgi:MSHA type pilus biogenesis protein MshL